MERWRGGSGRLIASKSDPLWLIPLAGPASENDQELDASSVWIAEGEVDLQIGAGADVLVAYEGSETRPLL